MYIDSNNNSSIGSVIFEMISIEYNIEMRSISLKVLV